METRVLHAVHIFGNPSETFIRDAIAETAALGWIPWVVTEAARGEHEAVPGGRLILTPRRLALPDRFAVRLDIRRGIQEEHARVARAYLAALARAPTGVLHAHFGWTGAACTLAARTLRLPMIVSLHGTDATVQMREPQHAERYRRMLRQVDRVTVVSRFLEQRLRAFGHTGAVDLVASGVRLTEFRFVGPPRAGTAPRLLFIGRLIECKGLDTLIEALVLIKSRGVNATLSVIGDGPQRGALQSLAARSGAGPSVSFLGTRPHQQVREELGRADIVVVPSRVMADGQAEGSSVVSKEAQAVGVPVVATDVGGLPETFPPQLRHELVPQDRPDLLAARIAAVWEEREHWLERVRLQREWIESEFAWEKIARRLAKIYEEVQERHPAEPRSLRRLLRRGR